MQGPIACHGKMDRPYDNTFARNAMIKHVQIIGVLGLVGVLVGCISKPESNFIIKQEERNPWTSLVRTGAEDAFQFAIISDRTGLPREGVLEQAVAHLNRLQPAFVMSVGDLVEGYTLDGRITDLERIQRDWDTTSVVLNTLTMPFFYVVGNNDINSPAAAPLWTAQFGERTYYHFVFKDVLFVALNSEDPLGPGGLNSEQQAWLGEVLTAYPDVRWTFLFLHRPLWTYPQAHDTWAAIEALFGGRPRTVFAGHRHQYERSEVDGHIYYTLGTTGGGSQLTGATEGWFDHITWVAIGNGAPHISNLALDGIWDDDPREQTLYWDARDGQQYPIMTLGAQTWMVRNMAYALEGTYCYDDELNDCAVNGRLYPWELAVQACPATWRLASDADWKTLEVYLGMDTLVVDSTRFRGTDQGRQMRAGGESGFDAPISGYRRPNGSYARRGERAAFWMSTAADSTAAWHRDIRADTGQIYRSTVPKGYALSVRCVRDLEN